MPAAKKIIEDTKTLSRGQVTASEVSALLRARNPLLWVSTREEARVESSLVEAAASAGYKTLFWDVAAGVADIAGRQPMQKRLPGKPLEINGKTGDALKDAGDALEAIRWYADRKDEDQERIVWVFRDIPIWLDGQVGATVIRQVRNLSKFLPSVPRSAAQAIILLTTSSKVPADLTGHATVIDWPLPDRSEVTKFFDSAINSLPEFETDKATGKLDTSKPMRALAWTPESRDLSIDAAVGLTQEEAQSCFAKSIVVSRKMDPALVMSEKKRVISKSGLGLEWHDPIKGGLDAVGGLDSLKQWLAVRRTAYSPAARAYGLPAPKGAVLVGVWGCGKSLMAKTVATDWQCPLIRLDLGKLKAKYVGDSEANIRAVFKVIETIDRCVLWIDEIEKAMAGASSGAADGGVSSDALGVVLNWMQERTSNAFVIATANSVENLPPELLRKGRFDEIFFVGLPNDEEREGVFKAALRANGRGDIALDFPAIVAKTATFSGAEIAELVPTALYAAFADGAREITTNDILEAAEDVNPISKTRATEIKALYAWGEANARPATGTAKHKRGVAVANEGVQLDLD
jgi:ATP-dependent 26S proteasome regulatory subunit